MSNVNGNDMDDLFKRAADGYPLRTNSSDWSRLAADLDKDPSLILPPLNEGTDKRRRRGIFWLFLLLPVLGGLGFWAWHAGRKGPDVAVHSTVGSKTVVKGDVGQAPAGAVVGGNEAAGKRGDAVGKADEVSGNKEKANEKINEKDFTSAQGSVVVINDGKGDRTTLRNGNKRRNGGVATPGGNVGREKEGDAWTASGHNEAGNVGQGKAGEDAVGTTGKKQRNNVAVSAKGNKAGNDGSATVGGNGSLVEEKGHGGQRMIGAERSKMAGAGGSKMTGAERAKTMGAERSEAGGTQTGVDGSATGNAGRSGNGNASAERTYIHAQRVSLKDKYSVNVAVKAKEVAAQKEKEKDKTPKKKPSFYVGVTAGPDLSTIKMQRVSGAGTTFGLILGYNFGNRWGVETGLNLDHKKYYSQGEYFDKSGNPRLANIDILNLDGYCNMLEIPVNVRYNLGKGEKTRWFATAGLSTYLMNKEHYNYEAKYIGGGPSWPGQWTYKTPHDYWFSILNFSIGYEQKLGNVGNLRLEPYLRVPLSGMGTGRLPIMSTGLNIGFTRRIW